MRESEPFAVEAPDPLAAKSDSCLVVALWLWSPAVRFGRHPQGSALPLGLVQPPEAAGLELVVGVSDQLVAVLQLDPAEAENLEIVAAVVERVGLG